MNASCRPPCFFISGAAGAGPASAKGSAGAALRSASILLAQRSSATPPSMSCSNSRRPESASAGPVYALVPTTDDDGHFLRQRKGSLVVESPLTVPTDEQI